MKLIKNEGFALIIILWVIVIVSFLLISLTEDIYLESYLTRNLLNQVQIQQIAQAGIARGIAALLNDETLVDGREDGWTKPIFGRIEDQGTFKVVIEDIGSRINANFFADPILSTLIRDKVDEFILWRIEHYPFYHIDELSEFGYYNFHEIIRHLTFYGKFNINTDDYSVLKEIMLAKKVSEWQIDPIIEELKKIKEPFHSVDELIIKIPVLDVTTFSLIQDELVTEGGININLVDEETLYFVLGLLKSTPKIKNKLQELRSKQLIEDVNDLKEFFPKVYADRMVTYFNVSSRFFQISCTAKSTTSSIEKKIVVEIERIPSEIHQNQVIKWNTKILSWVES